MKPAELDAIKQAAAEELGISGIDAAEDLRELIRVRLSGMNALDRAAFDARVGMILSEAEHGKPKARFVAISYLIFAAIAWFIWRPLAPVIVMSAVSSYVRAFAIRRAELWHPNIALLIGASYGIAVALIVRVGAALTLKSLFGDIVLSGIGFLAAGYIGHGAEWKPFPQTPDVQRRILAQVAAVIMYVLALAVLYFVPSFVGLR